MFFFRYPASSNLSLLCKADDTLPLVERSPSSLRVTRIDDTLGMSINPVSSAWRKSPSINSRSTRSTVIIGRINLSEISLTTEEDNVTLVSPFSSNCKRRFFSAGETLPLTKYSLFSVSYMTFTEVIPGITILRSFSNFSAKRKRYLYKIDSTVIKGRLLFSEISNTIFPIV